MQETCKCNNCGQEFQRDSCDIEAECPWCKSKDLEVIDIAF